jgi:hypothetical protein
MATAVRNRFFLTIAVSLAILIVAGFSRTYYLRTLFELPPLPPLLHLHGIMFTAWLVVFVVQARLIAAHNVRTHMKLGVAGAVLAGGVVIVGTAAAIATLQSSRVYPMGLSAAQFLPVPLSTIALFGTFVALALVLRRRPAIHKRLMVLAMIAVLGPPTARLIALAHAGPHFLAIQMTVTGAFLLWCLLDDWIRHRMVHPVFAIGGALLLVSWPLRFALAKSALWAGLMQSLG